MVNVRVSKRETFIFEQYINHNTRISEVSYVIKWFFRVMQSSRDILRTLNYSEFEIEIKSLVIFQGNIKFFVNTKNK